MLKKIFYLNMYQEHRHNLLEENMRRIKTFSFVIIVLEFLFLIATYVLVDLFPPSLLKYYRWHYYGLLLGASVMILISLIYRRINKYDKIFALLSYLGFGVAISWGVSVTLLDLRTSDSMAVYLTFVFMTSFVFVVKPSISFGILTLIQSLFVLSVSQYPNWHATSVNSTVFVLFAWFVGRYQYFLLSDRMARDLIIEEKNEALEKQNIELVRLTMVDHLTGTFNRYSMDDILAKHWAEAYINRTKISVMMLDIDNFKMFNDTYGHIVGDTCLVEVSKILIHVSEKYKGYAFRYGGDEFCLLFNDLKDPQLLIDQIRKASRNIQLDINEPVEVSIGLYEEVPQSRDAEWLCIDRADKKLYEIKSKRNRRKTD